MQGDSIYTVTELTQEIKDLLEGHFSEVTLMGEISNFHAHGSGHYYFTLKDEKAQISAAMFRGSNRSLKFVPEDGLEVIVRGRVSVYGPRGNYQIIVEAMEPKGLGALQLAFEQLKKKLEAEGLFAEEKKQALPFLPHNIGIITSPTGAALRDMVHVLHRRFPRVNILLYPVHVQGEEAPAEIVRALSEMNEFKELDVLILGRGGGSLEDLWAFNTEGVARAIAASKIPVVSAVGHETDFTISDFVADLRAPTPSAAAELTVPVLEDLESMLSERAGQLFKLMQRLLQVKRGELQYFSSHLKHPKQRLQEYAQHIDLLTDRLRKAMTDRLADRRAHWNFLAGKLEALSPLAILKRGYSIAHLLRPDGTKGPILKDAKQAVKGDLLQLSLHKGEIRARVERS